jgi:TonB family protein
MSRSGTVLRFFVFSLIVLAFTPLNLHSQQDDFANLVFGVSEALLDATKTADTKPSVRVENFRDSHGAVNEFGIDLANQFSDLLEQSSKTPVRKFFAVLGRLPDASAYYAQPCDKDHPWPKFVVKGDMDLVEDRLVVWVQLAPIGSETNIFERRITYPLTPAMEASLEKHPAATIRPADVWVRPGYVPSEEEESNAAQVDQKAAGFVPIRCAYCPRADYSDAAMATKIQGTVTVKMLVSADGNPLRLQVTDGMPCGLNKTTLESLASWKLKPAKAPDGSPVEVWQEVVVTFQLY